ncbi:aspartate aminotransferase [Petrotoga sp. HWH.PT.55.6.1]|uniref:aspartate aminotransferase n=1 Tax=unclassified Petrotoga TaxID=2620614 RepID=UPI000CA02A98|nr:MULTISPECIES: aspartate aminotransferase [unclassified Petrotoga]PNR91290.1 aspartate aminotransferase [Petrotoga sp. HWHPT.55.6.3]RPD35478.1 aspartate aminotransferase [Petrotoga sp. HWH.PT.55.6.1]
MEFSTKIESIQPSTTIELNSKALELQNKGYRIVRLTAGEPDFDTPQPIINAAYQAMKEGKTKYTDNKGIKELRHKIAQYTNKKYSTNYNENNVIVTNGGKQSLFNSLFLITNPGDEIIVIDPSWVSYDAQIKMVGGIPVHVKTTKENNYIPEEKNLEKAITKKTKAIIINSPNNPTGVVYDKEFLIFISKLSIEHDIIILSDEVYDTLIYDGNYTSMATFEESRDRTIFINSFSKTWSMTGWRVGYTIASEKLITQMAKIQSHSTSNVNTPSQYAALKALETDNSYMVEEFKKRRDYLYDEFKKLGFTFNKPKGAFYYFIDISKYGLNDKEFCEKLLDYGLAVVPGSAFFSEGHIRLSFAASMDDLQKAVEILKKFLRDLEKEKV